MKFSRILAPAGMAAAMAFAGSASAQLVNVPTGLVVVNLSDVNVDIAKNLNVNVSDIPVTVQAPISVAATVCDVAVNALASQRKEGGATCTATSTNDALTRIVDRSIRNQSAQSGGNR
jgi:hypothetical protein